VIALLRGEVAVRRADHVVILCGGVGHRAAVSAETLRHVPVVGGEIVLHTHLIARDDTLSLYGFASELERDLFLMLLSVQAVGPKVALAVLSGGPPRELIAALAAGDAARFQAAPGVGKRTAERIIVELREKVIALGGMHGPEVWAETATNPIPARAGGEADSDLIAARRADSSRALARDGLVELGYTLGEAEELLRGADGQSAEQLIAQALATAHGRRAGAAMGSPSSPAPSSPGG
jgi:Holliday junction DNA helicase RuvA